jgi:hypothetical protein
MMKRPEAKKTKGTIVVDILSHFLFLDFLYKGEFHCNDINILSRGDCLLIWLESLDYESDVLEVFHDEKLAAQSGFLVVEGVLMND